MLAPANLVLIGRRPAILARNHAHPIRAQRVQLGRRQPVVHARRFDISVARQQQMPVQRLQQTGAVLPAIGPRQKRQHRMLVQRSSVFRQLQRHRRRRFGDHADRPKPDRVPNIARLRQRLCLARSPDRTPGAMKSHQTTNGRGFPLARLIRRAEKIEEHEKSPVFLNSLAGDQITRARGFGLRVVSKSSVIAQTRASTRSGLAPLGASSAPNPHI